MVADIYSPSGQLLTTLSAGSCSSDPGGSGTLRLSSSGTYTILVHEAGYRATGSYSLSIQSETGGGCNSTPIACGQTVTGSTARQSEMDAYSYTGTAGQLLAVALWGFASCTYHYAMVADIYNPSGQLLTTLSAGSCSSDPGGSGTLRLSSSGTYTILVHEAGYRATGSYSLSIQSPTAGGCNSTPIACGQTVTGGTAHQSEMDAYSYTGTAGQLLAVALWGFSSCTYHYAMVADIYNPSGQLLTTFSAGSCSSDPGGSGTLRLSSSGTYTILVHEAGYRATGSYSLSIQSETGGGCNSTPIACGQTVTGSTAHQSEMDGFSYTGTAGQLLAVALWGYANCTYHYAMAADIYSPSGQLLTTFSAGSCSSDSGASGTLLLSSSGTYTILVHEAGYRATGNYALSIQSPIGGGCNSTPIACGQTVNTNIASSSQMRSYGYGTGGGTVIFSFSGYSGARFDLYDPTGTKLFTCSPGAAPMTNLPPGTYTLLAHDVNYSGTGNYGFSVTCIGSPCNYLINPTSASVSGAGTNGSISVTAGSGCVWSATTTNGDWLRIMSGSSGFGDGTVSYAVDANCGVGARSGTITISPAGTNTGWAFDVYQASPVVFVGDNVGNPGAPGSLSYTCGAYTVAGSGEDIQGTADDFYFLHEPLSGDGQIIVRCQGLQGGDPQLAEAGVMIREILDAGSKHVFLTRNEANMLIFRRRLANDATSVQNVFQGTNCTWLRLMRMGSTFVAHTSTDGVNWQYVWFTTVDMSSQVQVGLAVTARHFNLLATNTFDNVSIGSLTPLAGTWLQPTIYLGGELACPAAFQALGGFKMLIADTAGDRLTVLGSQLVTQPLATWTTLGTVTNTYGVVPFVDAQALTNSRKFYRLQRVGH